MNWFIFIPDAGSIQDPTDPKQYRAFEDCEIFSCSVASGKIYAIKSSVKAGLPRITDDLLVEMAIAMRLKKNTENVLLRR